MSDITLRSQAMTNQSQQFYDSQRQESGQQMVNTLGQSAQMFVQRQQHAEQQQNIQRELAMREAESGMKMALFQQEQQQNAMKLQMMAAMDQADMGREQVRGAKLQNDMLEEQVNRQKQMASSEGQFQEALRYAGGVDALLEAGTVTDMTKKTFTFDPDRATEMLKSRQRKPASANPMLDRDRILRERMRFQKLWEDTDDPAKKEEYQQQMNSLDRQYSSFGEGQGDGQQDEGVTPTGPTQAGLGYDREQRAQQTQLFEQHLSQPSQSPIMGSLAAVDPETKHLIASGLAVFSDMLVQQRHISPEMAPRYVANLVEKDALPVAFALAHAGYSHSRIESWMRATGIYKTEAELQNAMKAHARELERLMRPVK